MKVINDTMVFVEVVNTGSFTAAAEALDLSKSVVSKYVTRLESRLGVQLLHRSTRRLSLTEPGQTFYQRSREALNELSEAEDEVTRLQDEPRGLLRINTPMSFGIEHIAPHLAEFRRRYPHIEVDMYMDDRMTDVISEGFDASIRIADLPDSSLVARKLAPCRHVIVASDTYLSLVKEPRIPEDLCDHTIVSYRYQASALQWDFQPTDGKTIRIDLQPQLRVNNSLAIRELIRDGAGIARMPTFVVGEDIKQGLLRPLLANFKILEPSIYLVFPERRHISRKVQVFAQFLQEFIGIKPNWDAK